MRIIRGREGIQLSGLSWGLSYITWNTAQVTPRCWYSSGSSVTGQMSLNELSTVWFCESLAMQCVEQSWDWPHVPTPSVQITLRPWYVDPRGSVSVQSWASRIRVSKSRVIKKEIFFVYILDVWSRGPQFKIYTMTSKTLKFSFTTTNITTTTQAELELMCKSPKLLFLQQPSPLSSYYFPLIL